MNGYVLQQQGDTGTICLIDKNDHQTLFFLCGQVFQFAFVHSIVKSGFLSICLLFSAVKPDPPESLSVQEIAGYPKRLNVSWNFPSSWPIHDAFPLKFQIRYKPQGSVYWSEVSTLSKVSLH